MLLSCAFVNGTMPTTRRSNRIVVNKYILLFNIICKIDRGFFMIHIDEVSVMTPAQDVFIAYLTRFQCDDVMLVHDFSIHQYNHFMWTARTRTRIANERERANRRGCECVHELDIRNLCIRFSSQLFSTIILLSPLPFDFVSEFMIKV